MLAAVRCSQQHRVVMLTLDSNSAHTHTLVRTKLPYCTAVPTGRVTAETGVWAQVPMVVADAVRDHLLHNCAQLGAGYALSQRSDAAVAAAHEVMKVHPARLSRSLLVL